MNDVTVKIEGAYLWQSEGIGLAASNNDSNVRSDFQFSIDRQQASNFISLLEQLEDLVFIEVECKQLLDGQPHSCDNKSEIWGRPIRVMTRLILKRDDSVIKTVIMNEDTLQIELDKVNILSLIDCIKEAYGCRVFFEYDYTFKLGTDLDSPKFVIWPWNDKGTIEYAN